MGHPFAPGPGSAAAYGLGISVGRSHLAAHGAAVTEIWASLLRAGMISSEAAPDRRICYTILAALVRVPLQTELQGEDAA